MDLMLEVLHAAGLQNSELLACLMKPPDRSSSMGMMALIS